MSEEYHNSTGSNHSNGMALDMHTLKTCYYSVYAILIFFGTTLNLWMFSGMITSPKIRSRLRNKLLLVFLMNNLLTTVLVSGIQLASIVNTFEYKSRLHCSVSTWSRVIGSSLMWIEHWYFLILLAVYLTHLINLDPGRYFSTTVLRIGEILLLVGPWAFGIIVAPSVIAYYSHRSYGVQPSGCLIFTYKAREAVQIFGKAIPLFLKVVFLVAVVALYFRQRRTHRATNAELLSPGPAPQLDDVKAYVSSGIVSIGLEAPLVFEYMVDFKLTTRLGWFILIHTIWFLIKFQTIFIPPCFLFFADIRHRLKMWRPWYRPGSGIDLTVSYRNKADDE